MKLFTLTLDKLGETGFLVHPNAFLVPYISSACFFHPV